MQWDFQNKGKSGWTGKSSFVLEVPLRYLGPSIIYSVLCDRIMQRASCGIISGVNVKSLAAQFIPSFVHSYDLLLY